MTGRQKIEAAFSEAGTCEFAAVIPYEDIYIRDNWAELTACPWWYFVSPDIEHQMTWRREVAEKIGQDWVFLPECPSRAGRDDLFIEERPEGVFLVRRSTGEEERLKPPVVGGWDNEGECESVRPGQLAKTIEEINARITLPEDVQSLTGDLQDTLQDVEAQREEIKADGTGDLAARILEDFGRDLYPISHVNSPIWFCYELWGFEGMMLMVAEQPKLVKHACERYLMWSVWAVRRAAALGAAGIWIEECLTDMIDPDEFAYLSVPCVSRLADEIRHAGMKSIYYFCGYPMDRLDAIISTGTDALAFEESKKGFQIDIAELADYLRGKRVLLGNLDTMRILESESEEKLKAEIIRQLTAGRKNGGRFIMSLGSPVTPGTPISRVRLYCDLVREL